MDVSSIEYIPRVCDLFDRKVKLEDGKEVHVEVWDSAGSCLNYFEISYSTHSFLFQLSHKKCLCFNLS